MNLELRLLKIFEEHWIKLVVKAVSSLRTIIIFGLKAHYWAVLHLPDDLEVYLQSSRTRILEDR